jgi:lipopolysaccharide transport system permease protein
LIVHSIGSESLTDASSVSPLARADDSAQRRIEPAQQAKDSELRYFDAAPGYFTWLAELFSHRDLIVMLAKRDVQVRYRQTLVGVAWAVLQPLSMMAVFVVFFHLLGQRPVTGDTPLAVTLYCGMLPWQFFANGVNLSTRSLVANQQIITKVYFPRLALPVATVLAAGLDLVVSASLLGVLMMIFHVAPSWTVIALPLLLILLVMVTFAIGIWLAAANALYRDVEQAVPFCIQLLFFLSPVVYETSALIPARWQPVFLLNPVAGVIEGIRWSLLGVGEFPMLAILSSCSVTTLLLAGGLWYFRRVERFVADRI